MWRCFLGPCAVATVVVNDPYVSDSTPPTLNSAVTVTADRRHHRRKELADGCLTQMGACSTAGSSCCGPVVSPSQDAVSFHRYSTSNSFPLDVLLPSSCSRGNTTQDDIGLSGDTALHSLHDTALPAQKQSSQPLTQPAGRETIFSDASTSSRSRLLDAAANGGATPFTDVEDAPSDCEEWGPQLPASAKATPSAGPALSPLPPSETAHAASSPACGGRLHVALSASSIRDIAASDPTMRIRNLKLLAYGPGTVVLKGSWQGLLVAVKFMLYRRGGPACKGGGSGDGDSSGGGGGGAISADALQQQVASLLAAHCIAQRSAVARVYACDVSEVVAARPASGVTPHPAHAAPAPTDSAPPAGPLTVRSCCDAPELLGGLCSLPPQLALPIGSPGVSRGDGDEREHEEDLGGSGGTGVSSASSSAGRQRRSTRPACFHFSSVVYCEEPSAPGAASAPTMPTAVAPPQSLLTPGSSHASVSACACAGGSRTTSCSGTHSASSISTCASPIHPRHSPFTTTTSRPTTSTAAANRALATAPSVHSRDVSTLHGLLQYLGARPGDLLLHCVMELHTGGNLWHGIRSGAYDVTAPHGPRMLLRSARGVAQGLAQLHAAGDVHGGLTPSNVMLQWVVSRGHEEDGGGGGSCRGCGGSSGGGERARHRRCNLEARIADCGVRRLVLRAGWRAELASNPELRACTAPELRGGDPTATGEAVAAIQWAPSHDVYSFGVLLYCICTGALPHAAEGAAQTADTHIASAATAAAASDAAAPAQTPEWPSSVWAPLRSLGQACTALDPAQRPSARDVVKTLLVWEHRLRSGSRAHLQTGPTWAGAGGAGLASYPSLGMAHTAVHAAGAGTRLCAATCTAGMLAPGVRSSTAVAHVAIAEGSCEGASVEAEAEVGGAAARAAPASAQPLPLAPVEAAEEVEAAPGRLVMSTMPAYI